MPCAHRTGGPAQAAADRVRRRSAAPDRRRGRGRRGAGRGWPRRGSMPRWRNCTCACVQASVAARSKALASWCLSMASSSASRDVRHDRPEGDARRAARRDRARGGAARRSGRARCRRCWRGAVRRSPRRHCRRRCRGRGSGRDRSRSRARRPPRPRRRRDGRPRAPASSGPRRRRVARMAPAAARYSVCTKSLEKAWCAASAAAAPATISA